MLKDDEILTQFEKNLQQFFMSADKQRDEIHWSLAYMHGYSREREKTNPKKQNTHLNIAAPMVRAISGSDIMQDRRIDIVPIADNYDVDADIMDDVVEYAQHASGWRQARALAGRDAAACGIGATASYLDMTKREYMSGVPTCKRINPVYLFFDTAVMGNDLNTHGNFCGYGDPMDMESLEAYVNDKLGKKSRKAASGLGVFAQQFMDRLDQTSQEIDLLYHYFWREHETVYDVTNPMMDNDGEERQFAAYIQQDEIALNLFASWADENDIDETQPYWTLDKQQLKALEEVMGGVASMAGADFVLEMSSRKVWCYYRAEIGLGLVLSKSKSYSQNCYPLNFITGNYDERKNVYYGFMRPLSEVQDVFNTSMDNLMEIGRTASIGGKQYIEGGADEIKRIKQSNANEDDLTPLPAGAKIFPKDSGQAASIALQTTQFIMDILPRVIGLGQEFFGVITTGNMTDSLFGRAVKQSFAVLEDFSISAAGHSQRQGQLFTDMMLGVARAEEGRILPILSPGHEGDAYIRLTKDSVARNYVVRVIERPITDDERQETLKTLMQLAPQFQQSGINIMPFIVKNLNIDQNDRAELMQLASPQPQPANPLDVALSEANVRMINAQAAELETKAEERMQLAVSNLGKIESETEENYATATKYLADANQPKQQGKQA